MNDLILKSLLSLKDSSQDNSISGPNPECPILTRAVEEAGLGEDDEGAGVAGQDAAEEDVTQLPPGRHDYRGPEREI